MSDTFSHYVQKFFREYLVRQKGYGPNTTSSYATTFSLFIAHCGLAKAENMKITDLKKSDIDDFISWLKYDRNCSDSTCNVRLAHMRSFANFLCMESPSMVCVCSEISKVPFRKLPKEPPKSLSEEAVRELLAAPGTTTRETLKHSALLSLLYDSGCRVQELIDLRICDLSIGKNSRLVVNGKGNKKRYIPILPATTKLIKTYIAKYSINSPDSLLFESKNGGKMTRQGVSYILNKYALMVKREHPELIGTNESIHPYILRHSKATHLVNANVHIFNVRDFLGHESVQTTQIYLTSNPEVTRKAIEEAAINAGIPKASSYSKEKMDCLQNFLKTLK
jgi:site-specific recombinase XerD